MKKLSKYSALRYAVYTVEIFLCLMVQSAPYLLPEIFGGRAIVLLSLAVSFAVLEDDIASMVLGAVCGLLADCSNGGTAGFYSFSLVTACFLVSGLFRVYLFRSLLTVMMVSLTVVPLIIFMHFIFFYAAAGYGDVWQFFVRHYISRIVLTTLLVPVFCRLNGMLFKNFREEKEGAALFWE